MVGAEVRAVRERVGIMDVTAFTKVEVSGPGAEALLDRLVANKLPQQQGGIVLTYMLNRAGRIELETTVVRLSEGQAPAAGGGEASARGGGRGLPGGGAGQSGAQGARFYLVCAAFFEQRLLDHLNQNRAGEEATITALSDSWAALSLNGPRARDVLGACTDADLSNAAFRWLSAQEIMVAGHKVWAFRMSYAGELGWELHMPDAACLDVYNALWAAGQAHGIANYGSFAMNVLRMEKAFPGAGELTNEVTLPEAGVMRFVKTDKDLLSKDKSLSPDPRWLCTYLEIAPDGKYDGNGGEAVRLNGQVVGATASVAYGHTVGKILAFAYVRPEAAVPGTALEVLIAGAPRAAKVLGQAAYDPENMKPRTDAAPTQA